MFYRLRPRYSSPGPYAEWETCNHDLDSPVAQHNLRDDAFPDFQPEFQTVLLSRKSSRVDFVHAAGVVGGTGLLVSEKALGVLEGMKLPPYQVWMQILLIDDNGWIDFARSEFRIRHHLEMDDLAGEPVEIGSERELKRLIEEKEGDHHFLTKTISLNGVYARAPLRPVLFRMAWRVVGPVSRRQRPAEVRPRKSRRHRVRAEGAPGARWHANATFILVFTKSSPRET